MAFSTISSRRFGLITAPSSRRPQLIARQVSGRTEPFNENVAQVKRLISRDRKEFLGNSEDILDKYTAEFGDSPAQAASTSSPAAEANPFTSASMPLSADNPFKTSTTASSPFSSSAPAPKPFKQSIEPRGLTPDMSPDPIVKETPFDLIKSIGPAQIVVFFTFSSMIGLMISTFWVVVNAGGVRLAGLD